MHARTGQATAALLVALATFAVESQAQFADALRRTNFTVFSGDVNLDGARDDLHRGDEACDDQRVRAHCAALVQPPFRQRSAVNASQITAGSHCHNHMR